MFFSFYETNVKQHALNAKLYVLILWSQSFMQEKPLLLRNQTFLK